MILRWPAVAFVAFTALVGVIGTWTGYPFAGLWRGLAAVLLVALLIEWLTARRARLEPVLDAPQTVLLGEENHWRLRVLNAGRWRRRLRAAPVPPATFHATQPEGAAAVDPGQALAVDFAVTPRRLGPHRWPAQPVAVRGVFGLADWIRSLPPRAGNAPAAPAAVAAPAAGAGSQTRVPASGVPGHAPASDATASGTGLITVVEPRLLTPAQRRAAGDRIGRTLVQRRAMSGTEFRSLRDYVPGDATNVIDWKASARARSLVVRETEMEQQLSLLFVVDCGRTSTFEVEDIDLFGHAANLAARMSEYAEHAGDRYGLMLYADAPLTAVAPARGARHLRQVRQALTRMTPQAAESNPLSAVLALLPLLPQRALVLFVTQLDDPGVGGQLTRAAMLLRPRHLPMIVAIDDPAVAALMRGPAASLEDVYERIAARETRRLAREGRARLERLGAVVVTSTPLQVEAAVFERYRALRAGGRV